MSETEPQTDFEQKPANPEQQPTTDEPTVTSTTTPAEETPEQQESQPASEQAEAQEPSQPSEPAGSALGEDQAEQPSEEPAQQQQEEPPAEEGAGQQQEPQPEEGEGEEKKDEEEEEEPVVVTPEGSPHWLSTEAVTGKGVPEAEVENYKNFYFKQAHALHTWYDSLEEHTFPTKFLSLTTAEVDVLLAAAHPGEAEGPELSEEQQELLAELEKKIDEAMEGFGEGKGGCVKINTRSPTDSVLERNDATFIAEIRDAVINEVEVENQSANAYAIWTEKPEERPGVFRRGVTAIRSSLRRRPRARSEPTKLEEEKKDEGEEEGEGEKEIEEQKKGEDETDADGEKKPGMIRRGVEAIRRSLRRRPRSSSAKLEEEKPEGEGEEKEGEGEKKEEGEGEKKEEGEGEDKAEEDKGEEDKGEKKEEVAEAEGEKKEGEEEEKGEEEQDGEKKPGFIRRGLDAIRRSVRRSRTSTGDKSQLEEEQKEGEEEKDREGEGEQTPAEPPAEDGAAQTVTVQATIEGDEQPDGGEGQDQVEGEQKEGREEEEGGAKPEDVEIEEVKEEEGEESKDKSVPRSLRKKPKTVGGAHASRKGKSETVENQLLRAFARVMASRYRVSTGKEALDLILRSIRVKQDLAQLKAFGEVEDLTVRLLVREWEPQIPSYPGMHFRGFVYKNELHALSQYDDTTYYPNVYQYKTTIQRKVEEFFTEHVSDALKDFENYIIDFFVAPEKIYIFRLLPFYTSVGACLFTWREHAKIFLNGPFEFRVVETPKTAPKCFSSLQPEWGNMLTSVLQQMQGEEGGGRHCVLL